MQDSHERQEPGESYYTVREAANYLRVAESTVWRWVDKGLMPAYRLPGRRLRIRKEDVETAVKPARSGAVDWRQWITEERGADVDADELLARVRALNDRIRARRDDKPLPSSVEDIREAREEWARRLDDI